MSYIERVKDHRISIPTVLKVGKGTLDEIGQYLKNNEFQVVIFFGNGLIDLFGERAMQSMAQAEIEVLEHREPDTIAINDIIDLAFGMNGQAEAVIGTGGGKVIDAVLNMQHF